MDIKNKQECFDFICHVVSAMQKWKSIYMENDGTSGIYNSFIAEDGKFDAYLISFIKAQDLGINALTPLDFWNTLWFVNIVYPAVGIILSSWGEEFPGPYETNIEIFKQAKASWS